MTDRSDLMMLAVVVVAFIAGYSIVSYVVRKLKAGPSAQSDQGHKDSNSTTEDPPDL